MRRSKEGWKQLDNMILATMEFAGKIRDPASPGQRRVRTSGSFLLPDPRQGDKGKAPDQTPPMKTSEPEEPIFQEISFKTPRANTTALGETSSSESDDEDVFTQSRHRARQLKQLTSPPKYSGERADAAVRIWIRRCRDYFNDEVLLTGLKATSAQKVAIAAAWLDGDARMTMSEESRLRHFIINLREDLFLQWDSQRDKPTQTTDIIDELIRLEGVIATRKALNAKRFKPRPYSSSHRSKTDSRLNAVASPTAAGTLPPKRDSPHWSDWCKNNRACFRCGSKTHRKTECPQTAPHRNQRRPQNKGSTTTNQPQQSKLNLIKAPKALAGLMEEASVPEDWSDLLDLLDPEGPDAERYASPYSANAQALPLPRAEDASAAQRRYPREESLNTVGLGLLLFRATLGRRRTHEGQALLDCGATDNFVDEAVLSCFRATRITPDRIPVRLPQDNMLYATGRAKFPVQLGTFRFDITALIVPNLGYDVILGRPWFVKSMPDIDWRTGDVSLVAPSTQRKHTLHAVPPGAPEIALSTIAGIELISPSQVDRDMGTEGTESCLFVIRPSSEEEKESELPVPSKSIYHDDPRIKAVLNKHKDVFREELKPGLPPERQIAHSIDTRDTKPINVNAYPLSVTHMDELKRQLHILLEAGLIRPSASPWGFPVLFVKKANGTWRMCVDFRMLNKDTVKNTYPLPRIDALFDYIGQAKYLTKFDLLSGFWQVRMAEDSIPKTAFNTQWGKFEFLAMPFGLTNAPATFQAMMNQVLEGYNGTFCVVYLDDVLIFSNTLDEHIEHIDKVLTRLQDNELAVKPSKCAIAAEELDFCGYVVGKGELRPMPMKLDAIREWPRPVNVYQIRQLLGLAEYYRRCIKDLSKIVAPLSEMIKTTDEALRKKRYRPIQWNASCEQAFLDLKETLTTDPVVRQPRRHEPYVIETDASEWALGCVLLQKDPKDGLLHPVAYDGKKLTGAELNYPVHEKELLAIKHAINTWYRWIDNGTQTTIITDHEGLRYLETTKNPSKRLARWVADFQQYNIKIVYRPGKDAIIPDAISRRPDFVEDTPANVSASSLDLSTIIDFDSFPPAQPTASLNVFHGCDEQEWHDAMLQYLRDNTLPSSNRLKNAVLNNAQDFRILQLDGIDCLYRYYPEGEVFAPYIEPIFRQPLVRRLHREYGHFGQPGLLGVLTSRGYWPDMKADIDLCVKTCPECQVAQRPKHNLEREARQTLYTTDLRPFDRWSIDFIGRLPKTPNGNCWIITAIDYATGWPLAKALPDATAETTASFIYNEIYVPFGAPKEILTDNGTNLVSKAVKHLVDQMHTVHHITTPAHPRTNGKVENLNGTLGSILTKLLIGKPTRLWDEYLGQALFAARVRTHAVAKRSPFYLLYGIQPRLLGDDNNPDPNTDVMGSAFDRLSQVRHARSHANELLLNHALRSRRILDTKTKLTSFQPGDWVLVRHETKEKFEPQWFGPFKVLTAHPLGTYALQEPQGRVMKNLVNGARLVKANVENPESLWSSSQFSRALRRRGMVLRDPQDLHIILESVEADVLSYANLSTTSHKEWEQKWGRLRSTQEEVLPHERANLQPNPVLVPPTQTAHFPNPNDTDIDDDATIIMSDMEG
ncbi:Ribonuclease H-like protein [Ascosphaera apis ARSEF 7405]|uniref:RNA-directed DNA polymerase n=1 Tax=Ascosphaera apis ARSEF 7405 TaxID=392613 RepID=A0A168BCY0_9EURO|nr:Ribonuclease H-like protein [Ascosphaera apis ARSEF 7405]